MVDRELLAIFDDAGRQIGVKPRADVHRDGDWHMLVFVLSARSEADGRIRFLLQLRARPGDPYRGQVDTLAGGHVWAMESPLEGALRECHEEVGLQLEKHELTLLGSRFLEDPTGVCRRVIHYFYLCQRPLFLADMIFTDEVDGFIEVDLNEFAELIKGQRQRIDAQARTAGHGRAVQKIEIAKDVVSAYSVHTIDNFLRSIRAVRWAVTTGQVSGRFWD